MNNNWFEIEQMMRSRQHDLLTEAADLRRAQTIRAARRAAQVRMAAATVETRQAVPVNGIALTARLGRALVAIGRRLQGASGIAEDAATCGVCGKHFPGMGPVSRA